MNSAISPAQHAEQQRDPVPGHARVDQPHDARRRSAGAPTTRVANSASACAPEPVLPCTCGCWNAGSPGRGAAYGQLRRDAAGDPDAAEQQGDRDAEHAGTMRASPWPSAVSGVPTTIRMRAEGERRDEAAEPVVRAAGLRGDVGPHRGGVVGDVVVRGRHRDEHAPSAAAAAATPRRAGTRRSRLASDDHDRDERQEAEHGAVAGVADPVGEAAGGDRAGRGRRQAAEPAGRASAALDRDPPGRTETPAAPRRTRAPAARTRSTPPSHRSPACPSSGCRNSGCAGAAHSAPSGVHCSASGDLIGVHVRRELEQTDEEQTRPIRVGDGARAAAAAWRRRRRTR